MIPKTDVTIPLRGGRNARVRAFCKVFFNKIGLASDRCALSTGVSCTERVAKGKPFSLRCLDVLRRLLDPKPLLEQSTRHQRTVQCRPWEHKFPRPLVLLVLSDGPALCH